MKEYNKIYYQGHKEDLKQRAIKRKEKLKRDNPQHFKELKRKYRNKKQQIKTKEDFKKDKARRKANYKININGVLCFDCKIKQAKERHHEDYNKPYNVLLLFSSLVYLILVNTNKQP